MSVTIDSNAPYFTEFPLKTAGDAVYMTAEDDILGNVFAIVYRAHRGSHRLSVILIGAHGTSGYVDMTLDRTSRYFGACRGLATAHYKSPVRRALAIAALRTYASVDKPLRQRLRGICDESAAGSLGSRFRLVYGKFPSDIGKRVLDAGLICAKRIESCIIDIVYEDNDLTIDQNNELVYLLGEQLEQLFDPLSEYSPEPTERLYAPPTMGIDSHSSFENSLDNETKEVQDICEEIYLLQAHARGDILDLLQTVLIPLRIEVLKGRFPALTIARLNTVFPPTIDELFRVNNIFYESLRTALPFGAFEVIKACGATIPYFFRASMRHEAATQNIKELFAELVADNPDVQQYMRSTDINKIERIIKNSSHLISMKRLLDRLVAAKQWSSDAERHQVEEFCSVAKGTVDAFTNSKTNTNNHTGEASDFDMEGANGRKLASAGKILEEITEDWPAELEYGWVNRRVVAVFDGVDVLEPTESIRQLHTVFIVFTDSLVVCQPSEPIPSTSLSGLHVPSVGDMLMHAMLNEAPLDKKLPPLRVTAWASILDVHFACYDKQRLFVFSPGIVGAYKLLQPDSDANNLVTLLAKAKITTKAQPFHLFKINGPETTIYSTVQELDGYRKENNRTNVALFLSTLINERTLKKYGLVGAVSLRMTENGETVKANIVSRMRYSASFEVKKTELKDLILSELTYLTTLSLSSQNPEMLDVILASNRLVASRLIQWASQSDSRSKHRGHKKNVGGVINGTATQANAEARRQQFAEQKQERDESQGRLVVIPSDSVDSLMPINHNLRKIAANIPPNSRDINRIREEDEPRELDRDPSMDLAESTSSYSSIPEYSESSVSLSFKSATEMSFEEEAEQRDVDNWYHQLHNSQRDDESLSSGLTDTETGKISLQRSDSNASSIQIGGFLDNDASILYNQNAGRAFPKIESNNLTKRSEVSNSSPRGGTLDSAHSSTNRPDNGRTNNVESHRRQVTESSFETIASLQDSLETVDDSFVSGNTTVSNNNEIEDFSYLATLVDATSFNSKMSELEKGGVYPSLRETSLVRLGSYILRTDKSQFNITQLSIDSNDDSFGRDQQGKQELDEKTPTLHSSRFIAAPSPRTSPKKRLPESVSRTSVRSKAYQSDAASYTPYADLESADWHPLVVKSGTTATLSGLLPRVNRYADRFAEKNTSSEEEEDPFGEENHEIAKRYLAWAESSGRPVSLLSTRTINEFLNEAHTPPPRRSTREVIPESKSQLSFRRMVMSSSLHTLQLASFVVQIDQKEQTSSKALTRYLREMKNFVTSVYKTRSVSQETELILRRKLTGYFALLLKFDCQQLAHGLLEIEWYRRTRISESYPQMVPTLWRHD